MLSVLSEFVHSSQCLVLLIRPVTEFPSSSQGDPLTWKTWRSQGFPEWLGKSQGKWKKSGEVKSGVFFSSSKYSKTRFSAGADLLGELTMLPQTP